MANNVRDALRDMLEMHAIGKDDVLVLRVKEPIDSTIIDILYRQAEKLVADGLCRQVVYLPMQCEAEIFAGASHVNVRSETPLIVSRA